MTEEDAIEALQRVIVAKNTVYTISENVPCHFYDGMVAFARALKHKYGFSQAVPTPGFFGPQPPQFVHVKTGPNPNDNIQVPFGSFKLPNISGVLQTGYNIVKGIPVLNISGKVKAREKHIVMEIVNLTKQFSKAESIYSGKSIILERNDADDGIDFNEQLEFFDAARGTDKPIFNRDIERLIDVAVMTPITKSSICRARNIPLKRGVLLSGPYGTGKSMTAKYIAKVANENGWTFILCKSSMSLKYALNFAKMYQPCVIFAEDIDRLVDDRNEGANDLINDIDGVVGKRDEIITVLTTNFANKIDKAMLRPGRLDTIVALNAPDAETVERLVRFYAKEEISDKEKIDDACKVMADAGHFPSTISEIVQKAKMFMIQSGGTSIGDADLQSANLDMGNHMAILDSAREGKRETPDLDYLIGNIVKSKTDEIIKIMKQEFEARL
jgi:transitional endoplasmic reticulum ATPase